MIKVLLSVLHFHSCSYDVMFTWQKQLRWKGCFAKLFSWLWELPYCYLTSVIRKTMQRPVLRPTTINFWPKAGSNLAWRPRSSATALAQTWQCRHGFIITLCYSRGARCWRGVRCNFHHSQTCDCYISSPSRPSICQGPQFRSVVHVIWGSMT